MPIYKYTCRDCGEAQSHMVKAADRDGPLGCRECGLTALDREVAKETPAHNTLRSARPDRFNRMKERLDAEAHMYDVPPEDRAQHEEHIAKLVEAENNERTASEREDFHKHKSGIDITK